MVKPERHRSLLFADYCETSSCGGVVDWYKARHWFGKAFWLILVLAALGVTAWQTWQMFADYFNGGSGRLQSVVSYESLEDAKFPTVTVCNFNRANATKIRQNGIDRRVFEYGYSSFPFFYDLPLFELQRNPQFRNELESYEAVWKNYSLTKLNGSEPDIRKLVREYGHDCPITFNVVTFGGVRLYDICEHFNEVITPYGRCWRYKRSSAQHVASASMGLKLLINPALSDYLHNSVVNNFIEEGVLLMIGYGNEEIVSNPIIVAPSTHAYVALSVIAKQYSDADYQVFELPCRKDGTLQVLKHSYTRLNCQYDCLANYTNFACGCVPVIDPKNGYKFCSPRQMLDCAWAVMNTHFECFQEGNQLGADCQHMNYDHPPPDWYRDCAMACLVPCNRTRTLSSSVSYTTLSESINSPLIVRYVKELNVTELDRNFTKYPPKETIAIDIFFPLLEMPVIDISEETPVFTFISNLGGQIGLWTGICLMSIVQLLYYIFAAICATAHETFIESKEKKRARRQIQMQMQMKPPPGYPVGRWAQE